MNAQTPVGVIPAIKTVRRIIEVAVLETTSETAPQAKSDAQTQKMGSLQSDHCRVFFSSTNSWVSTKEGAINLPNNCA